MKDKTKYQVKCRVKKGDQVIVLSGDSAGKSGKVEKVCRKTGTVLVSGLNLAKRHTKPSVQNPNGGIQDKAMPMPVGKVAVQDPSTKKASRVGYKVEGGKKTRVARKSKTAIA